MRSLFLFVVGLIFSTTLAAKGTLPHANDFSEDSKIATKNAQTIVVMFSANDCPFCGTLAKEILEPMQITQENSNYVIRKVDINSSKSLVDFDGSRTTMEDFAYKHNVELTPTLAFFDDIGLEHVERIIGIYTVELLGYYIDTNVKVVSDKIAKKSNDKIATGN